MVLGTAMQTYGDKLTDQQEVLTLAADIIIDVFAAESALLRAAQAVASSTLGVAAAEVYICGRGRTRRDCGAHGARRDDRRRHAAHALAALRRLLKPTPSTRDRGGGRSRMPSSNARLILMLDAD